MCYDTCLMSDMYDDHVSWMPYLAECGSDSSKMEQNLGPFQIRFLDHFSSLRWHPVTHVTSVAALHLTVSSLLRCYNWQWRRYRGVTSPYNWQWRRYLGLTTDSVGVTWVLHLTRIVLACQQWHLLHFNVTVGLNERHAAAVIDQHVIQQVM